MQNKVIFSKILILSMSVIIIGGLWIFSDFLFSKSDSRNLNYIPNEAVLKLRLNGKSIISKSIKNVCFENTDTKLLVQLDTLINQTLRIDRENTGIDYFSEFGAFIIKNNQSFNLFLTLNLNDSEKFEAFVKKSKLGYSIILENGNVGVIQVNLNKSLNINTNYLTNLYKSFTSFKFNINDFKNDLTITGTKLNNFLPNTSFRINCNFLADKILINGKIDKQNIINKNKYSLSKKGLHLSINQVSTLKKIDSLFKKITLYNNELNHFEINYRGISLIEGGNPYFAEPELDLIISFKKNIIQDSVLNFINKYNELGFKYENKKLTMGKSNYLIKILDSKQIYISKNLNNLVRINNSNTFEINGSPEFLTKIRAPEYITSFFEMMTPYAATKSYLSSIQNVNISIKQHSIDSEIKFKKNKNSFQELLKSFLILKGIQ